MTKMVRVRLSLMAWCISILFSALLGIAALSAVNHPQSQNTVYTPHGLTH